MNILIVESTRELGALWARHLERQGASVRLTTTQEEAVAALFDNDFDAIVLDLVLEGGSAFAVADYASYRRPKSKVIFVTNTTFFSDGSIFQHIPNACAFVQAQSSPDDIAAIVEHYAGTA